jgi:hypothetical protein
MVVASDTVMSIFRIRDEIIDMEGSLSIEIPQIGDEFREDISKRTIQYPELEHIQILLMMTPVVADRSMTVAKYHLFLDCRYHFGASSDIEDLGASSANGYLLGLSTTRTDDDIITREIEAPECKRTEKSCKLVLTVKVGNLLEPARIHISPLEHRMIHITDTRIDICIRIELEQMERTTSAHPKSMSQSATMAIRLFGSFISTI